jgi:hypothetical protein
MPDRSDYEALVRHRQNGENYVLEVDLEVGDYS